MNNLRSLYNIYISSKVTSYIVDVNIVVVDDELLALGCSIINKRKVH